MKTNTAATKQAVQKLIRDERGANLVEYIIVVALIAVAGIAAFRAFGTEVSTKIGEQTTDITGI